MSGAGGITEELAVQSTDDRMRVLYLAPWVDIGGSDTATIDWFRFLDRQRVRASLITTQPSLNRRLVEVAPYAEELWELPQLMAGEQFPRFILSFIHTRGIRLVHIMNSRLGFEMLPDIVALPTPPKVVVQLHGEEPNRSGYVRYATTRYGNLVDAFSLTTRVLSERVGEYDIPRGKRRVIPIGVDAAGRFCPDRVRPVKSLDSDGFQILFPARLTEQKDPLLMVEVAARLRAAGLRFQIHVLGDGDLTQTVREQIARRGLEREVLLHGATVDVAPWYAGCAAVLLTSQHEGLPCVAYEAMAMGMPIVLPDLPGLDELVTAGTGILVRPRDAAQAYADAIGELATDGARRKAIGQAGRARVRAEFSLERMASEHGALYEELVAGMPEPRPRAARPSRPTSTTASFRSRRPGAKPLVSVIVTCFNQGRYLPGCLESVARQTYQPIETILVDDQSTDPETLEALASVERDGSVTVLRLPSNRGPAGARNAAIEHVSGRYVLPLDGDDLLLENAVTELVEQLGDAGDQIGFIYPNLQFFGNRTDYLEMPSYNLYSLLAGNQCAISSLIDREVFDRGFRYAEEITLGHEDWDFVLTLAEHGVCGEVARTKTVLCRKHGFTRSDLVDASMPFGEIVASRHPELFARRATIKADWNPGLTLIALDPMFETEEGQARLVSAVAGQTCPDFELIICTSAELRPTELGRRLRRVPCELAVSRAQTLAHGLELSRGRYALATYGSAVDLLADPALIEKTLRLLRTNSGVAALALADAGSDQPAFYPLDSDSAGQASLGALCWTATGPAAPPASLSLAGYRPLETLARWLGAHTTVQWRHMPRRDDGPANTPDHSPDATLGAPHHFRPRDAELREAPVLLPECPPDVPYRVARMGSWRPPQSRLLCRHRQRESGRYVYTNSTAPPEGCELDHVLGSVREFPFAGTASLLRRPDNEAFAFGETVDLSNPMLLGFVEQQPLALFDAILTGRDPETGQPVLVVNREDRLGAGLQEAAVVGFIEPYPLRPPLPEHIDVTYGLAGLVRTVDLSARRHRYGAGYVPPGVPAGELGALFTEPTGDCDPLWIDDDGRAFAVGDPLVNGRPSLRTALLWTGDPLTWTGFSRSGPKLRASARRALDSARLLSVPPPRNGRPREPVGYLLRSSTSRTVPLHAAIHPVTGDQLLSTDPAEAVSLGYREIAVLGHLIARAPTTGRLGPIRPAAPWTSRFGLVAVGS
jgi:glycosyltransferase involved in cell wall biosynthesis